MARLALIVLLALGASGAVAQEYSYDGNRWYDVEISIFNNEQAGGPQAEIAVPAKLTAAYLPRLRELQARSAAFAIDFPLDQLQAVLPMPEPVLPPSAPPVSIMGPLHSPAIRTSFRITDFARDAFVDLDARAAQFASINREIAAAPDHRLLLHKVWRQPMLGRAQTPAVFLSGGTEYGLHTELEGSLRLSDNAGSVMLDINIWLNRFRAGPGGSDAEWKIPALPFPLPVMEPDLTQWELVEVWQLEQTRELGGNQLYYLDHPAMGVLIQIRPYLLPPRLVAEDQADF